MERKLEGKQRKRVMDLKCVKVRETRLGSRVTNTHKWRMENWKNEWKEEKKKKNQWNLNAGTKDSTSMQMRNTAMILYRKSHSTIDNTY